MPSYLEAEFNNLWILTYPDIPLEQEFKAIPKRRFRLDFAHPDTKIGIEIQGQLWHKGRHNSGTGLLSSYEKHNLHLANGWLVFQLADKMIAPDWLEIIATAIKQRLK
jgi:hypothetical protein